MSILKGLSGLGGGVNVGGLLSGNPSISGTFNNLLKKDKTVDKVTGELRTLYEQTNEKTLQYPMDLDDHHYLMFNIQKRIPVGDALNNPQTTSSTKQTIVLPVPLNLRNDMAVAYNDVNLGVAGGTGAGLTDLGELYSDFSGMLQQYGSQAGDLISNNISAMWDRVKQKVKTDGAGAAAMDALVVGGGLAALNKLGVGAITGAAAAAKLGQGLFFANGVAFNPRMAVAFDNVRFREFSFNYRMIARNPTESEQIKEIVKKFQYHMLPTYYGESRSGFTYPDEFIIQFADAIKDNLFVFQPCVLKNVSVAYNTDSGPAFFNDTNAPITVDISLQFQETKIITKETFDKDAYVSETVSESLGTEYGSEQTRMLAEQEAEFR